ncbi:hypothetical protein C8R45DRAFT_1101626 [Mycena sanguinolenta]|nr:hypothetical protein C8R45DRAFT_1101626 [Mycena sanguinolenta]
MSAVPPSFDLNLQNTYGALLIGCFLSVAVWGVSLVQTILYFMMYEKDPPQLKLMILFLIAIDTANEILVLKSVWPALILHWGRVDVLGKSEGTVELIHHVWVAAIVAAAVQSYYTWRIYKFSGRRCFIPCLLIPLILWQLVGLGPYNFLAFGHAAVSAGKQTRQLTAVAISLRATGAATDILIAGAMIHLLNQSRTQIPIMRVERLLSRIIILSINSGAWTAMLAALDFIFIVAFPVDFTFCIFELPLCSLYLSTLLLNLNARKFINPVQTLTSIDLGEITWNENRTHNESGGIIPQRVSTGPLYLSQTESGSATLEKLTLTQPEELCGKKLEKL